MEKAMKQKKSYFWMYVILGYFILTLVLGIQSLFSEKKRNLTKYVFGETGFLIDFTTDIILMLVLVIAVVGMTLKYKWGWGVSLTYVALICISIILGILLVLIIPEKVFNGMSLVYGIGSDVPKVIISIFSFLSAIFSLFFLGLFGLLGRYIYKNKEFFRK